MEDIAAEAGITKVTLYSYFQSKENLKLALTYKALQLLIDKYYVSLEDNKLEDGLTSTLAIFRLFIEFCEDNFLYSEALLSYFELVRSTAAGNNEEKLTEAVKESLYFRKLQGLQNLPFKLTVQEINRGKEDGSIGPNVDPMLATLSAWISSIGYIKIVAASGELPLFNVDLEALKNLQFKSASDLLQKRNK
jgi:AcrR family transcriptional regulator